MVLPPQGAMDTPVYYTVTLQLRVMPFLSFLASGMFIRRATRKPWVIMGDIRLFGAILRWLLLSGLICGQEH